MTGSHLSGPPDDGQAAVPRNSGVELKAGHVRALGMYVLPGVPADATIVLSPSSATGAEVGDLEAVLPDGAKWLLVAEGSLAVPLGGNTDDV